MKEVMAIVRMNKMNQTKKALAEIGINSMTAKEVLGRGKGLVDFGVLKGAERGYEEAIAHLGESQRLIPKRLLTVVVHESQVAKVVQTVISVNKTGKSGDGKIFVSDIRDVIRIRTGERGDAAV